MTTPSNPDDPTSPEQPVPPAQPVPPVQPTFASQPNAASQPDPASQPNPWSQPDPSSQPAPLASPYEAPAQGAPPVAGYEAGSVPVPGPGVAAGYPNPGYPNPGYPPPGYQQPAPAKTDGVSIAALVLGIMWTGPIALILGIVGMRRTGPGKLAGRGLAIAGVVLGAVSTLFWIAVIVGTIFLAKTVSDEYAANTASYVTRCEEGSDYSCDSLADRSNLTEAQRTTVDTCGGRQPAGSAGKCSELSMTAFDLEESPSPEPEQSQAAGSSSGLSALDSMSESELRKLYDEQMPAQTKEQLKDPQVHDTLVSTWTTACEGGDPAQCDALGYVVDKQKDAAAAKVADTCGGKYPDGGMLMKCSAAQLLGE